ncbi:MAG: hypothetical protein HYX80_01540 [Chloroflexi bacterium]|nr:hypothetical protein [Chloroflexota bacterium]
MQSKYDDSLLEIMDLVVKKSQKTQILTRARALKMEITQAWADAQQAIQYLDAMISRYAPDKDWQSGFWIGQPTTTAVRQIWGVGASVPQPRRPVSTTTRPEHIVEVAKRVVSNGVVDTKAIISQLRTEGEQRPERALAISIGNILSDKGYKRIGVGKYSQSGLQPSLEVK